MFELAFLFSICAKPHSQRAKKRNVFHTALPGAGPALGARKTIPGQGLIRLSTKVLRTFITHLCYGGSYLLGKNGANSPGQLPGSRGADKSLLSIPPKRLLRLFAECQQCLLWAAGQKRGLEGNKKQAMNNRNGILQWAHLLSSSLEARLPNHTLMDWYQSKIKAQLCLSMANRARPEWFLCSS